MQWFNIGRPCARSLTHNTTFVLQHVYNALCRFAVYLNGMQRHHNKHIISVIVSIQELTMAAAALIHIECAKLVLGTIVLNSSTDIEFLTTLTSICHIEKLLTLTDFVQITL